MKKLEEKNIEYQEIEEGDLTEDFLIIKKVK